MPTHTQPSLSPANQLVSVIAVTLIRVGRNGRREAFLAAVRSVLVYTFRGKRRSGGLVVGERASPPPRKPACVEPWKPTPDTLVDTLTGSLYPTAMDDPFQQPELPFERQKDRSAWRAAVTLGTSALDTEQLIRALRYAGTKPSLMTSSRVRTIASRIVAIELAGTSGERG